jgi:GT2 family glycosyltransferase
LSSSIVSLDDATELGHQWKNIEGFLSSAARLNASRGAGRVREYQIELATRAEFEISSPIDGRTLRSGASIVTEAGVFFGFPDCPSILLYCGDLSLGYPASAVVAVETSTAIVFHRSDWGLTSEQLDYALTLVAAGWDRNVGKAPATVVLGDENFAHHVWNELPLLEYLTARNVGRELLYRTLSEPLGPLPALFPEIDHEKFSSLARERLRDLNSQGSVTFRAGGQKISSRMVQRVLQAGRATLSASSNDLLHALRDVSGPKLWVSVRTRNRTSSNQIEAAIELCRRFLTRAPAGAVILDGFSLGWGAQGQEKIVAADDDAAGAIRNGLGELANRIFVAVGLPVSDSIVLGQQADFYFCHHGTVQHKVGWFGNCPGVVHANTGWLGGDAGYWVAEKSELAVKPTYLPRSYVEDLASDEGPSDPRLGHDNYRFLSPVETAEFVMGEAEANGVFTPLRSRSSKGSHAGQLPSRAPSVQFLGTPSPKALRVAMALERLARRFPRTARQAWRVARFANRIRKGEAVQKLQRLSQRLVPAPAPVAFTDPTTIRLQTVASPEVSVIVPTYGHLATTLNCLASLQRAPYPSMEVIVVDDCFPNEAVGKALSSVPGVRYLRTPTNLGFIGACNTAAAVAAGKFLFFLNNDTEVHPNAIARLADVLASRPNADACGAKLLFPDGTLQEAGGIVWSDAAGNNYGRGQDPNLPAFNYVREVDFCTGAALMVRAEVFRDLGGFDTHFAPAYYEDVDLCFKIKEAGHKVIYVPTAVVTHFEGVSHGTDPSAGIKAHQTANARKFAERWAAVLSSRHHPNNTNFMRARDGLPNRKVVLIADGDLPRPDRDAGSKSTFGIVQSFVDAGWVVKYFPQNRAYDARYTGALEQMGVEVLDVRLHQDLGGWVAENGSLLNVALFCRPDVAADQMSHIMRLKNCKTAFYGVDLHCARMRMEAQLFGDEAIFKAADLMEILERRVWRNFDHVLYPSEEEAAQVRAMEPRTKAVGITPFSYDISPPRLRAPDSRTLLFVGGFGHPPNKDAVLYLLQTILPLVEGGMRQVRVKIVGGGVPPEVQALASASVEILGFVSEERLNSLYDEARVSVSPLRFGAGVKGKVCEAVSRAVPVVTTSVGAQGIWGLDSVVPVRDTAEAFAAEIVTLLTDDRRWLEQSRRQYEFATATFSKEAMRHSVLRAIDERVV